MCLSFCCPTVLIRVAILDHCMYALITMIIIIAPTVCRSSAGKTVGNTSSKFCSRLNYYFLSLGIQLFRIFTELMHVMCVCVLVCVCTVQMFGCKPPFLTQIYPVIWLQFFSEFGLKIHKIILINIPLSWYFLVRLLCALCCFRKQHVKLHVFSSAFVSFLSFSVFPYNTISYIFPQMITILDLCQIQSVYFFFTFSVFQRHNIKPFGRNKIFVISIRCVFSFFCCSRVSLCTYRICSHSFEKSTLYAT